MAIRALALDSARMVSGPAHDLQQGL